MPDKIYISRIAPHYWEEPVISGSKGTAAVFFSGCALHCIYCQNSEISQNKSGKVMSVEDISEKINTLLKTGCHTLSFITPTHYADKVIDIIERVKPDVPVVYNTSGYESLDTLRMLDGYIDIYLPDYKYSSDELAREYSKVDNYHEVVTSAIEEMVRQTGTPVFDKNKILQKGTVVRHLVLPNHTKNSIKIIEYLSEKYGEDILFSLMGQYIPHHKATTHPKLGRKITKREYQKVLTAFTNSNLDGFCQELTSADEKYIPEWY